MSSLLHLVRRLVARPHPAAPRADLDHLSLRDWADLPVHHPRSGKTSF